MRDLEIDGEWLKRYLWKTSGVYDKYVKILENLEISERSQLFEKIKTKYDSLGYIQKELKLGYEPRTELYNVIFRYASLNGQPLDTSEEIFPTESYLIDDSWIVSLVIGQGSVILLSKKEEP